jgi:hypothetical protein
MRTVAATAVTALALACAPAAAALCAPTHNVVVGPAGPVVPELHVPPDSRIGLELPPEAAESRLVFDTPACETVRPTPVGVEVTLFCSLMEPGTYQYRVEGFGAGTGVVVVDPVDWVTVAPARRVVVFGDRLRLTGTLYPGQPCTPPPPGRRVQVQGRAVGAAAFVIRAAAPFGQRWRTAVRPRVSTEYRASWSGRVSGVVRIDVRPRVTLRRARGGRLRVTVLSARNYRGRWVAVQRRTARGWRFARAVRLGRGSTTRFRVPRRHGVVRVYVPRSVAGRGYVAGFSRPLRLR